ncbi:hypothetical protein H6P87_01280 [Rickettsia tillamookensis]|uniref:Uncharacterized protein n=1 Tax=Rickettsia tillamookensis TaxID=2761623 RepID=A0A9E6SR26_9RICK|nr:hypothetical protein [Rickettsia tillamookensis]QQV75716.1 hypothetical protein H6P87_01280 [Rickettsia tillamookensis]
MPVGTSPTQRFNTFITDGLNVTTIASNIFAKTIEIKQNPANLAGQTQLIWTTPINTGAGGVVQFGTDSMSEFQDDITSNIDFNGTSATAILDDGVTVTGDIDDILGGNLATLNFAGGSTVTGDVGATNTINTLNVKGNNPVNLQGNVKVNQFNFTADGIAAVGGTLTATAGVQYNDLEATLAFSNPVGAYIFSSPILQAGNGGVMVDTTLTATDSSIATAKTIQIGAIFPTAALTLAVNNKNLNLLAGGNQINFESAKAGLVVASPVVQAVTFGGNLDGFASGGGNVILNGTNALTVQGGSFGAVNKLASVSTIGNVQAQGGINLSGITTLNVTGNSNFTDQTATSASAANINIGDVNGLGTYILTPNNVNFNISTANMKFKNAGSILNITSNGNVTAAMNGDLDPGAAASGIIQLSSTGGLLTITGGNNLGINGGNTLNSMILAGNGDITITPAINIATPLSTGIAGNLTLTTVNGPVNFTNTTTLAVTNITGKTDFVNNAGIINLAAGGNLAAVTSTGGINGVVNVLGAATLGPVTGITALNLNGAGIVTINGASSATNLTINNADVVATAAGGFTGDAAVGAGQLTTNTIGNVTIGTGTYTGDISGTVTFGGAGILNTTQVGGKADFVNNAGTINLASNGQLGAVTSTGGVSGTVNVLGAGTLGPVTGITALNLNGAGAVTINGASSATNLTINNADVVATAAGGFTGNAAVGAGQLTTNTTGNVTVGTGTYTGDITGAATFGGAGILNTTQVGGKVDFVNNAGIINLNNNGALTIVTSTGGINGTVNVLGAGALGPVTGITALNLNEAGNVVIVGASSATNLTINNADVVATAAGGFTGNAAVGAGQLTTNTTGNVTVGTGTYTGNITGTATFGGAGTINTTNIGGQTDFKGSAGTVNVNDTGTLAAVTSSAVAAGNLVFLGGGNVTGVINNIGGITVNAAGNKTVTFQKSVSATSLTLGNNAVANLQDSLTTSSNVDFTNGGILEFSGTNLAGYTLNSPITNGNTGTLNVYTTGTTLTATDSSIGTVNTINIGQGNGSATFTIDVSNKALTLGSAINLNNTNSIFGLTTSKNQQVTFTNSVDGFAGGGGSVNLSSTGNGVVLEIQGIDNKQTLGTAVNKLAAINVTAGSEVGVVGGANKLDVSNVLALNIGNGAIFADQSITSAQIAQINIGDNNGPGTYALDALNGDFQLKAPGVTFVDPASVLKLMTTVASGNNSTIELTGNIEPLVPNTAIVEINAKNANTKLTIDGTANEYAIGTKANPVSKVQLTGQGTLIITALNTPNIDVSVAKVAIGSVGSNVFFSAPSGPINTELGVVQINGNMDFQNNAATAIFASDTKNNITAAMTGNITSTGGTNGTVIVMDNLTVGGTVTNLAMFKGGADGSIVRFNTGGNMSIGEIQGTGTGTILFAQAAPTTLDATINQTGGTAVDLVFPSGGSISGDVGSANNPIGTITAQTGTLIIDGKVTGDTAFMIDGATIQFNDDVNIGIEKLTTPAAFMTPSPLAGTVPDARFNSADPETIVKNVGTQTTAVSIQINGNDVTFTNDVINISNIDFTSPQAVTATFASSNAIVGGTTTNANRLHTIAISGDLTTGTSPFGSDSNHLKTVQFEDVDAKITIDSEDFYSSITTKTNNQGTAIFNANNGFTDDLGGKGLNLKLVQFSSNKGTVKGDTYAKDITIDAGKSAVFTGYNSRSLDIPSATVGGVKVPRATTKFNYKTLIVSENLKGSSSSSSAEYTNAALVQAPINGGSHKFDDDVWLQKPVTGTNNITFAPKKTAFIASDLGAATIVADQATMMFTGDNTSVNVGGNISGSNITFDLGNNKITYTGSATPTGELIINVFYDTTNAGQTGNTSSGNIVLASGSSFDLSNVSSIKVFLTVQNNPSAIGQGSAYPIISGGGNIIVGNAASLPFNVTANEGGFVRWQITNGSFVLLPIELTGDNVVDNIIGKIIKAPPGSDAAKVANVLVNTPIDQRGAVVDHLRPIIERPSNEIHRVTTPLTPMGPSVGPSVGGFSPIQPPPTSGSVVNNIYVPPTTPGGYDVTPSNPAGYNTPTTPVTGTGGFGPNGPSTGGGSPSVGTGGFGPNGPGTGGNAPSGSVTGGVFTPNGPSVVAPSGPATGGSVGGFGPNGPGTAGTTGGNIGTGGVAHQSAPADLVLTVLALAALQEEI